MASSANPPQEPWLDPLEVEQQLRHGSFFVQASLEQQGKLTAKLDAFVTGIVDLLLRHDVVTEEELGEVIAANRRQQVEEASEADDGGGLPPWPTVVIREDKVDPAAEPADSEAVVNCAERMPICRAACCSLPFPLSAEEVERGRVKWDLGHPYLVRHSDEGFCVHNDRSNGACGVYEDRPQVCHGYSCANDERIWTDFEHMVLNTEYLDQRRTRGFRFTSTSAEPVPVSISRRNGSERPAAPVGGG